MNIVVIGTGMYSTGRGTSGYGTILPAIIEWQRDYFSLKKVVFSYESSAFNRKMEYFFRGVVEAG